MNDERGALPTYAEAIAPPFPETWSVWRHVKTGGEYLIVGPYQIEATWEPGILYRPVDSNNGVVPVGRSVAEFTDGRFERLA